MVTILMVDDESMLLELYRDVLEPEHRVLLAHTASEAMQILAEQNVDAVGCDYFLGVDCGADVMAWIRAHKPELLAKSILISGMEAPRVDDVLVLYKPVSMDMLVEIFDTWFPEEKAHAR